MASKPVDLAGASVLVAGATGGLGSAIAREMAARGASLTLTGRSSERLEALGLDAVHLVHDLRDPAACRAVVDQTVAARGGLDVLVDMVGVVAFGPVADLDVDTMEELFLTDVFVPIMLTRAALAVMGTGGVIVHPSGVIAERNLPGMAAYGAAKAALRAFDEAAAREARRDGIRILDVRPPHTSTGLARRPIAGTAPPFGVGLDPASVARVICDAVADGTADLPSDAFV